MPKILDDLQKLEEERIDKMKDWFLRMVSLQETVPPAVTTACAGMRKAAETIDRSNDISQFIAQNRSGTPKPPEAKYEPYVSESPMLSRQTSRMTLTPQASIVATQQRTNSAISFTSTPKAAEPIQTPATTSPSTAAAPTNSAANSSPRMTRVIVRALYNYDATEDNELSFKANERIVVIQKDDSGWWHGELNGQVGIFPSNFVESGEGAPPAGVVASKEEPTKTATKCKVLYDYNADSDSELTIKEGDILTIETEDEGWYFGANGKGDTGRFPSNYVQTM